MADYSDDESVSSSESECEEIEAVLKKVPKAAVPEIKGKRVYNRKQPVNQVVVGDKLQKAREAKALKASAKKQVEAQERAELAELKKLKDRGQLKVKKEVKPVAEKKVKEKKQTITEVHHHYHNSEPTDEPKKPRAKKTPVEPDTPRVLPKVQNRMIFA